MVAKLSCPIKRMYVQHAEQRHRPGFRETGRYPKRPVPHDVGTRTVNGTRAAVRTVIRYRHGVLNGRGASLLDGYMEDLATDRISADDRAASHASRFRPACRRAWPFVKHTPQFITRPFDEELERLLAALPRDASPEEAGRYRGARNLSETMIVNGEFNPV
jgi:hypothetical protein